MRIKTFHALLCGPDILTLDECAACAMPNCRRRQPVFTALVCSADGELMELERCRECGLFAGNLKDFDMVICNYDKGCGER